MCTLNFEKPCAKHSHGKNMNTTWEDFSGGSVVTNLPTNAGGMGLIPGPRRSHLPQST